MANILHFGVTCWPGARAGVGVFEMTPGRPALAVHLDPVNLVITAPPTTDGGLSMAGFLRDLARQADQLADELDPRQQQQPLTADPELAWPAGPRHALRGEFSPDGVYYDHGV